MTDSVRPDDSANAKPRLAPVVATTLLFAGLWAVITQGAMASWVIGIPALIAAVWASSRLRRTAGSGISIRGLFGFIPFFLWESLRGGLDVAWRTLAPRLRIRPGFMSYRVELSAHSSRAFFAGCVSLLPGTLAADLQQDRLEIHVLNTDSAHASELARLERAVARLFREAADAS